MTYNSLRKIELEGRKHNLISKLNLADKDKDIYSKMFFGAVLEQELKAMSLKASSLPYPSATRDAAIPRKPREKPAFTYVNAKWRPTFSYVLDNAWDGDFRDPRIPFNPSAIPAFLLSLDNAQLTVTD